MITTNEIVRLRFSKTGDLRFIGHLDFLRVFQQMLRRAQLPVAYSQGFNPHILLSFALPLPLGMESVNDYADLSLEIKMPASEIMEKLNSNAPNGLVISRVSEAEGRAAAIITAADYLLAKKLAKNIAREVLDNALNTEAIIVPKKTKSGVKDTDIRPDILNLTKQDDRTILRLSAGSARFLNPLTVVEFLTGEPQPASLLSRLELYKNDNEKGLSPL